jgi:hypothetical protein
MSSSTSVFACGLVAAALSLAAVTTLAPPARADGVFHTRVTPADNEKLAKLTETRDAALAEARAGGVKDDLAILDQTLAGDLLSLREGFNPVGDWRCRTLKLGKGAPLVVYGWFKCRISDDGAGWRLEKLSGSQRTAGFFYDNGDKEMYYLGVLSVDGDPKARYGEAPARNQVARAVRPGKNRLRLEFPQPNVESRFDILELERGK